MKSSHILLIDDSPSERTRLKKRLKKEFPNFSYQEIANWKEFSQALSDGEIAAVITDFSLKWNSGLTVLSLVLEKFPACPVVFHTSNNEVEFAAKAFRAGAKDFVLKNPERLDRLTASVQSVLFAPLNAPSNGHTVWQTTSNGENALSAVIDGSPSAIYCLDFEGIVTSWNPGAERTFGFNKEEAIGKRLPIVPEEKLSEFFELVERVKQVGIINEKELLRQRKDGSPIYISISVGLVRNSDGVPTGIVASATDITGEKIAEKMLAEERKLFIGGPTVVFKWSLSDEMSTSYVSPNVKQHFGYAPEDFITGRIKYSELIHPEDYKKIIEDTPRRRAENPEFLEWEYRFLHADGEYRWVYDFTVQQRDETGTPVSYSGTVLDITERKKIEESLKTERSLFIGGPTVVIRWRPGEGWPVTFISPNVFQHYGYKPSEFISGKIRYTDLIHPEDQQRIFDELAQHKAAGHESFEQKYRLRHAKGDYRWVYDFTVLQKDENGNPSNYAGTLVDITELKKAEELLLEERNVYVTGPTVVCKWLPEPGYPTIFVSTNFKKYFGYDAEDFISGKLNYGTFVHPEDVERVLEEIQYYIEKNASFFEQEYRFLHADGEYRWIYDFTVVIRNEDSSISHFRGTLLDITERKQVEELLHTERNLFIGGPTVVFKWLPEEGAPVGYVSPNIKKQFGYDPEDLISRKITYDELVHPEDRDRIIHEMTTHMKLGSAFFEQEYRLRHFNGEYLWVHDFTVVERDGNAEVTQRQGYIIDITERKLAEQALQTSEERIRNIMNELPVIAYSLDNSGIITHAEGKGLGSLGFTSKDIVGHLIYDLYPDNPEYKQKYQRAFAGEQVYTIITVGGVPFESWLFPQFDKNGDVTGVSGLAVDITERKKAEEVLRETEERLSTVVSNLDIVVFSIDINGIFLLSEGRGLKQLGLAPGQIVGLSVYYLYKDFPQILENIQLALAGKSFTVTIKTGDTYWETYHTPVFSSDGKIIAMTGVSVDISERVKAEEALRDTEEKLRTVIFNSDVILFSYDLNGICTLSEGQGLIALGLKPGQLVGTPLFEAYRDRPDIVSYLRRGLAGETFTELVEIGGVYLETYYRPLRDESGKIIGATGVCTNITGRVRTEIDLRKSQRFLEKAQEAGKIGSWVMDLTVEPNTITVSKEFLNILGIESDVLVWDRALIGKQLYHEDREAVYRARDEANEKKKPFSFDYRIVRVSDNAIRWIHTDSDVIFDDRGKPAQIIGVTQDITERKLAEAAMKESEEKYRIMIEHATEAIVVADFSTGKFVEANEKATQLFEMSREELFSVGPGEVSPPYQADGTPSINLAVNEIQRALDGELPIFEWLHQSKSGRVFPCEIRLIRMPNDSRKLVRGAITDISERKLVQEELARRAEELARSNVELERFAYVASHDLQEPLRMIASYSQLLESRYSQKLEGDAKDFLGFIVDGSSRMRQLIQDLLVYSRVGTHGKPSEKIRCEDVLEDVLENLFFSIQDDQAVITHDPLPIIEADRIQIGQVFQNLISNAIKFRNETEPPKIHISAKLETDIWTFSVEDNGIGMKMDYAERIFVIFQRLHRRDEYPGTGIGLAICKKIIERHGGRIWVESVEGKGSTFKFTIPNKPIERRYYDGFQDND